MASLPRCSIARGGPLKISWARIALDTSTRAELLEDDRGLDVAHAHAAVLLADRDAEQVRLAQRVPRALRELLGLVPVARVGEQVALGDLAGQRPQRLLVLGLGERIGSVARHASRLAPPSEIPDYCVRLRGTSRNTGGRGDQGRRRDRHWH